MIHKGTKNHGERTQATRLPARVTFLGTGTSAGVPVIGCECPVCRSSDPRDRRLRPSIFVDVPGHAQMLVDTSSDLRQQALTHGITRIDAILFTHGDADHILGLDDVRRFNVVQGRPIPGYASAETWESIRRTFHYVFGGMSPKEKWIPKMDVVEIAGPFALAGVRVVPVPIWHGRERILGFRFGSFAYLTDCSGVPDESWPLLVGVETLVIDALRHRPHPTHFSVAQALEAVVRLAPRRAYFTHMNHELGHADTNAQLPPGVELAYDGLVLDVEVDAA